MIICGYAGIGKSYLAHNYPNIIDLESTPFEKDWDRYFKCAEHYSNQGFIVLLSCHKEIRERVLKIPCINRITIFPCINDKKLFENRYKERGNTQEFIDTQMKHWEEWTSPNNRLLGEHLEYMESGETLYDTIIRLSKLSPNKFCTYYDGCFVPDCPLMKDKCLCQLKEFVDKAAVMAEIEKLKEHEIQWMSTQGFIDYNRGLRDGYINVLSFLNSIEVKEVDLEKELIEWHKQHFKKENTFEKYSGFYFTNNSQIELAKHFLELGLKTTDWKEERIKSCPYRKVECTMYEGKTLECQGKCSWVVDYPKLKDFKAQKGE